MCKIKAILDEKLSYLKKACSDIEHELDQQLPSLPSIKSRVVFSKQPLPIGTFDGAPRCTPGDTKCTIIRYASLRTYCSTLYTGPHCIVCIRLSIRFY